MEAAAEGQFSTQVLAGLLNEQARHAFLETCARIERTYTEACPTVNEPCLASGCSLEGTNEICLQPLLAADGDYLRACAAEWIKLFRRPENRADFWQAGSPLIEH
ncbi:MAG: hypothetical protein ACM3SQ_18075 [Betaproteobacteria bacterium]